MSMPFCQVSRLTTQKIGLSSWTRPKRSSTAFLLAARLFSVFCEYLAFRCASVCGSQMSTSMPLTMPWRSAARSDDQPVEPHAEIRRADLLRIGRADRGDRPGSLQPGLQDSRRRHNIRRRRGSSPPPAGRVRQKCRRRTGPGRRGCARSSPTASPPPRRSACRRASSPPASHAHARRPARSRRSRRPRCPPPAKLSAAKRRQLSGQSAPVGIAIRSAGAVEEMRRVEHEQVEAGRPWPPGSKPCRHAATDSGAAACSCLTAFITCGIAGDRASSSPRPAWPARPAGRRSRRPARRS